ncbi:MAG TPA: ABC transporter permease [Firmicutes bacterium]|jgi:peptide/nickel transport system permease protein|nr:ABC transporter permease [Bacillota bacterium]
MHPLLRRLISRLFQLLLVLWGTVTIVFLVGRVLPADPAVVLSGPNATSEIVEATRAALGLDKPLPVQYGAYLVSLLQGDLGRSLISGRPVLTDLAARVPASLELVTAALVLAVSAAFVCGLQAALKPDSLWPKVNKALVTGGTAVPTFLLGILLLYAFYIKLPIAPAPLGRMGIGPASIENGTGFLVWDALLRGRWDVLFSALHHLLLPSITLAFTVFPQLVQVFHSNVATVLSSDAYKAVKLAKLPFRMVLWRYLIPPAVAPALNLLAASFGYMIGGTVLVEHIFGWNGLGAYVLNGINAGDHAVVQGVVLVSALCYSLAFFIVDVAMYFIDPRLREV